MDLPNVITELVQAQADFDSRAYAECFSETAVVFDEGKTHTGKKEIQDWIEKANHEYRAIMKPLEYSEKQQILKAEVSGTFPGSPAILAYHFELAGDKIQSLEIK